MKDQDKTKEQFISELVKLRQRMDELKKSEAKRKKQEKAMQESEERYRRLVELSPDTIAIHSEGKIVYINKAGSNLLGAKNPEQLIGKPIMNFLHPAYGKTVKERLREMKERERGVSLIGEKFIRLDGTDVDVQVVAVPLTYKGKSAIMAIARDITERKQAEEALRESREMFKELANLLPQIVFETDEQGNFKFVNRYAFEAGGYGYTEEDFWNVFQLFATQDRDRASKNFMRGLSGEELGPIEYTAIRKDGGTFPILLYANPVFRGNKAIGLRGIVIDITERKQAEEKIKQSLREKEMLLNEIHHRVKNNLQVISSLLDMSSMRTENKDIIDLYHGVRAKIHTMALIHSQLHRTSRFDKIDMVSNIHEQVEYLRQVFGTKNRFITPIIDHSDVYISISQALPCALVLNEVISNAFKHAFKGRKKGTIGISIKKSVRDTVFIRVRDNGIGIPEEIDINKVESLGLKLVRNLVQDQLKGKIQVKRNEGTEIIIKFKII